MIRTRTMLGINLITTVLSLLQPSIAVAQRTSEQLTKKPTVGAYQLITHEDLRAIRKDIRSKINGSN